MSRLWTLLGIAILALALSACGGEKAEDKGGATGGPEPTAAAGPVSIDFWHSEAAANETALAAAVDGFNSSQDEVKVRLLYQGSNEDINLKLLASLRSGDVPALVELDQNDFQVMVDSGAVTPIQKFIDAEGYDLSDFDKRAIDYYTTDDKLYSMPMPVAVPLTSTLPRLREAGVRLNWPGTVAIPDTEISLGAFVPSATETLPLIAPAATGLAVIEIVQLAPTASVPVHVVVSRIPVPVIETTRAPEIALPELVTVTVCGGEVVPTSTAPRSTDAGVTVRTAPPTAASEGGGGPPSGPPNGFASGLELLPPQPAAERIPTSPKQAA